MQLLLSLLSHLNNLFSDVPVALLELHDLVLELFIVVTELLDLLGFKLMPSIYYMRLRHSKLLDLQVEFVLFLFEAVDFLEKSDIFLHYLVVLLSVERRVLLKSHGNVLKVSLKVLSLAGVLLVHVALCC
jgi:hypothetical protein